MQRCVANSQFTSANDNDNHYLICVYPSYKFTHRLQWKLVAAASGRRAGEEESGQGMTLTHIWESVQQLMEHATLGHTPHRPTAGRDNT